MDGPATVKSATGSSPRITDCARPSPRSRSATPPLREPLEPPALAPARGPPTDWGELMQTHDDRDVVQATPDDLLVIDIHSL